MRQGGYNMKRMVNKMVTPVTKMARSIARMFREYEKALNELSGTPAFPQMFESYEMI